MIINGEKRSIVGINSKWVEKLDKEVVRELHSYGLRPVGCRQTEKYILVDRENNLYTGGDFELGAEDINQIVSELERTKPLHFPNIAMGLYYPGFYEQCLEIYENNKSGNPENIRIEDLCKAFDAIHGDEHKKRHEAWKRFAHRRGRGRKNPLCYQKKFPSRRRVLHSMFNGIITADKATKNVEGTA